jgi:glycine oxidase
MTRIGVIGGGVIGLSCAWTLAQAGCDVEVFDPHPGGGASHAAAGMLAPISEAAYGENDVLALGIESARQWPEFARRLEEASGSEVGLRATGTLLVAHDRDDAEELRRCARHLAGLGLTGELLSGRQTRAHEAALSPRTTSGLRIADDHSVDNRAVIRALIAACGRAGVRLHETNAQPTVHDGRATGVDTRAGSHHPADVVIVAAGHASGRLTAQATGRGETTPSVRPVKGQILRLHGEPGLLRHTIRGRVAGEPVYLVPRASGEIVVGATTEDVGENLRVTAQGVHDLLHAATAIVPELRELELIEALARLRPACPDNAPLIGFTPDGLLLATGHYRGGVLLAPLTARAVADLVLGRPVEPAVDALIQRVGSQRPPLAPHLQEVTA